MRPILTKDQIEELLLSPDIANNVWIPDENVRKQRYRELINSGDRVALISMVKSIYRHKEMLIPQGKKLHICDENFLRDAKGLLNAEFSIVLGINQEDVGDYIQKSIK